MNVWCNNVNSKLYLYDFWMKRPKLVKTSLVEQNHQVISIKTFWLRPSLIDFVRVGMLLWDIETDKRCIVVELCHLLKSLLTIIFIHWLLNSFDLPKWGLQLKKRYTSHLEVGGLEGFFGNCSPWGANDLLVGRHCLGGGRGSLSIYVHWWVCMHVYVCVMCMHVHVCIEVLLKIPTLYSYLCKLHQPVYKNRNIWSLVTFTKLHVYLYPYIFHV